MKVLIKSVEADIIDVSSVEKYDLMVNEYNVEYIALGNYGKIKGKIKLSMNELSFAEAEKIIENRIKKELI
jgi:hypothetical protein